MSSEAAAQPKPSHGLSPQLVLIAITAIYLVVELGYNLALIDLVADPESTREKISRLSTIGKCLAAFGLSWSFLLPLLRRFFPYGLKRVGVFMILWLLVYQGINWAYQVVLDGISQPTIQKNIELLTYRTEIAAQRISDPTMLHNGGIDPVAMIALPMMAFDERPRGYMAFAHKLVEDKLDEFVIANGGDLVTLSKSGEEFRNGYRRIMQQVTSMHTQFINNSMKVAGNSTAESVFKRRTGGMEPNAFLTRDDFFTSALPQSKLPEAQQLMAEWNKPRTTLPDDSTLRLSDLPPFLPDAELESRVSARIDALVAAGIETRRKELMEGPESRTFAAAVLVPPISMTLSLFTILISLGTLVHAVISLRKRSRVPLLAFQTVPLLLVLLLTPSSAFTARSGMLWLEDTMVKELGTTGQIWRKGNALEGQLLTLIGQRK